MSRVYLDDRAVCVPSEYIGGVLRITECNYPYSSVGTSTVIGHNGKKGQWLADGCVDHGGFIKKGKDYEVFGRIKGEWGYNPEVFIGQINNAYLDRYMPWWEFGQTDESSFKSMILFPFRLIVNIPIFIVRFVYRIIASIFVLLTSILILFPIKLITFVLSLGYLNGFKKRFISRLDDIWN